MGFLQLLLEVNQLALVTNLMKKLHNSRNYVFASFLVGLLQYNPSKFIDINQHVLCSAKTKHKWKSEVREDQNFSLRFAVLGQNNVLPLIEVTSKTTAKTLYLMQLFLFCFPGFVCLFRLIILWMQNAKIPLRHLGNRICQWCHLFPPSHHPLHSHFNRTLKGWLGRSRLPPEPP